MLTNEQKKELRELCVIQKSMYKHGMLTLVECITKIATEWRTKYDKECGSPTFYKVMWDLDKEAYVARHLMSK